MTSTQNWVDNLDKYKELIPKDIWIHLPIYKDLIIQISEIQEKLEKNFYRVSDIEKLKQSVLDGKIKPAKYSIIEEDSGEYKLVKFSDFFESEFSKTVLLLKKIDKDLKPGKYKDYINSLILAYQNNNFIDPYKKWVQLTSQDYPVDFVLFPTEPDLDKVFHSTLSFDASLRVHSPSFMTFGDDDDYIHYLINSIKSLPKVSEIHYGLADNDLKLQVRVDYSIFSSGVHFKRCFYGQNLPNERDFVVGWGSKIVIYKNVVDDRSADGVLAVARLIYEKFTLSTEEFADALGEKLLVHEAIEALMKFEGDEKRLGKSYLKVREMNSEMSGIKNYVLYLLKQYSSDRKIHNLVTAYLVSAFDYYRRKHLPENRSPHYYGYVASINYFAEKGIVTTNANNKINPDIKNLLKGVSELSDLTTSLLIKGTEKDAEEFFSKYSSEELFKRVLNIK